MGAVNVASLNIDDLSNNAGNFTAASANPAKSIILCSDPFSLK